MGKAVDEYIRKHPESYLGYYAKGLIELDNFFDKGRLPQESEITKAFKAAACLSQDDNILKYYFLAILIRKDRKRIKGFHRFAQNKAGIVLNDYKHMLVKQIIFFMRNRKNMLGALKNYNLFDSVDYLILHVLDNLYSVKLVENCNYLHKSIEKGRKSPKLIEAMFRQGIREEDLTLENVAKYARLFENISDGKVYRKILEKNLLTTVDGKNVGLVEKVISAGHRDRNSLKLIDKYIQYCIFTGHRNLLLADQIEKTLVSNMDENIALYLQWVNKGSSSTKMLVDRALKERVHFSRTHVGAVKAAGSYYLNFKLDNTYKIEITIPIEDERVKIDLKFDNYRKNETLDYFKDVDNYYYLPEAPTKIRVFLGSRIIECKEEDFKCFKISNNSYVSVQALKEHLKFNNNFSKINERFTLFLYGFSEPIISRFEDYFVNYIINNRQLFNEQKYIAILKRIDRYKETFAKEIQYRITNELLSLEMTPAILHDAVINEDSFNEALNKMLIAKQNGVEIQIRTFLNVIKRALNEKITDINLGVLCEEFVCSNAIINEDIYKFLENCYKVSKLNSDYTEEAIRIIGTYINDDVSTGKLIIYNYLNNKKLDYDFYNLFIKLYRNLGPSDNFIKECVNRIIHTSDYYYSSEYLNVFEKVYEEDKENMILLETLVVKSLQENKEVKKEYLVKVKDFYLLGKILSEEALNTLIFMAYRGYKGFEEYLVEMLKYEIISFDEEALDRESFCYKTEGEEIFKRLQLVKGRSNYAIKLGFCTKYKCGFEEEDKKCTTIERKLIEDNAELIISFYNSVNDKDFRIFAGKLCILHNIFIEDVLTNYMRSGQKDSQDAALMVIRYHYPGNMLKAADYIKEYVENFDDNFSLSLLQSYLLKFASEHLEKTMELMSLVHSGGMKKSLENLTRMLVEKAQSEGSFKKLEGILTLFIDEFSQAIWHKPIMNYIRNIIFIDAENSEFATNIYKRYWNIRLGQDIRKEIVLRKDDSFEYAELLYEFSRVIEDKSEDSSAASILLKHPKKCSREMILFTLKKIKYKGKSLIDKELFKNFIHKCHKDEEIAKELYHIAEYFFNKDIALAKFIFDNIDSYSKEAKGVLSRANDKDNIIIDIFSVRKKGSRGKSGSRHEGTNIFTGESVTAIILNNDLAAVFDRYINSISADSSIRAEGYYILKGDNLSEASKALEPKKVLKLVKSAVYLQNLLFDKGYALVPIYPEKFIAYNENLLPLGLYDCYEFNEFVEYKSKTSSKDKTTKLYEKDFVKMFIVLTKEILGERFDSETGSVRLIKNLVEEDYSSLTEFEYALDRLISRLENAEIENFNMKKAILDYNLLEASKKALVADYVIDQDFYVPQVYEAFLKEESDAKKLEYLLKNYKEDRKTAVDLAELLLKFNPDAGEVNKLTKELAINFIRSAIKNKYLIAKEAERVIESLMLLGDEDRESMRYLISSLNH